MKRSLFFLLVAPLIATAPLSAQVSREYQLKAAFLYNFVGFVAWPEHALPDSDEPFVIGILGHDPFGELIDELVRGERAKGYPLTVRRIQEVEQMAECQIVFISTHEAYRVFDALQFARGRPILTVSDVPGFATAGGVIGFSTEVNRIVLNVNVHSADASGLTISSKLLRVARLVPSSLRQ